MSDETLLGIAAVLGTLAGTGIGAFVTWKIQGRQIEHTNQARFHDRRVDVYADFLSAGREAFNVGVIDATNLDAFRRASRQFEMISIIGTRTVADAARAVQELLNRAAVGDPDPSALAKERQAKFAVLLGAIRSELGIQDLK